MSPVHADLVLGRAVELASQPQLGLVFVVDQEHQFGLQLALLLVIVDLEALRDNFAGEVGEEGLFGELLLPEVVLQPSNNEPRLLLEVHKVLVLVLGQ